MRSRRLVTASAGIVPALVMFFAVLLLLTNTILASEIKETKLVEIWNGSSHDALTSRLRDSLEQTFQESSDFRLSFGKKPNTLIVTIPDAVKWRREGNETEITYYVTFADEGGKPLGEVGGSCWTNDYSNCAHQIFGQAVAITKARGSR